MTEDAMKRKLYDLYQFDWLMSHGYSLNDVLTAMRDAENEAMEFGDDDNFDAITDRFYEEGIGSNIFACFKEFCDTELNDKDYVNALVDHLSLEEQKDVLQAYQKYLEARA